MGTKVGKMMGSLLDVLNDGDKSMQQAARMTCREGCVVAGRYVQNRVKSFVPVLDPLNAHGFPGIGVTPTLHNSRVCYNANIRYALPKSMSICYMPTNVYWNPNIYEVKRKAIRIAAKWILAHKCKKVSIKSAKK